MSGGTVIIIDPKQPKSMPDRILVDGWRKGWKMLSVWAFAVIGISPDLYGAVAAMGWLDDQAVPGVFVWSLRGLAVAGIAVRLLRQGKCEEKAQ